MNKIKAFYFMLPKQHQVLIACCGMLLILLIASSFLAQEDEKLPDDFKVGQRYQLALPDGDEIIVNNNLSAFPKADNPLSIHSNNHSDKTPTNTSNNPKKIHWQTVTVKSGDSLAKIFKRLNLSATTTHKVITAKGDASKLLKKLNVGDTLRIGKDDENTLVALEYPFSKTSTLYVNRVNQQYQGYKKSKNIEIREVAAVGRIDSNFWNAASAAGLDDRLIINLANIFGWDIDFAQDIRKDDSFNVIYQMQYVDGEYIGTGKILAAEFINQGETFQAIRFTDDEFYSADGKSLRKAFLRAPVNFKYISSNFKPRRFHPVQKRWKSHKGTDYAAKTGTPVVAAGNGKVTHSTYNKYNGHYVFIQHGNGIVTKYLHFSKRAVKKGQRVKQGQIIGYVGATGLAAGPHLHYEFLLNGVHRNPRTVKLPDAKPISRKYKDAFSRIANQRLAELSGSRVALFRSDNKNITSYGE